MPKKVNIYTSAPLVIFTPPAHGTIIGAELTTGDILYCLHAGARVEEILENGLVFPLGLNNFDKNNEGEAGEVSTIVKEEVKVETVDADTVGEPTKEVAPAQEPADELPPPVQEPAKEEEPVDPPADSENTEVPDEVQDGAGAEEKVIEPVKEEAVVPPVTEKVTQQSGKNKSKNNH